MANMNFAIAVRLVEQGVQNTANKIKSSLLSIQMQAMALTGALAGGIGGLSDMLSRLIDVARETSRVQTALKNVSGGAAAFGKNLAYIRDLANKYGLEVNGTTSAFTKFTAAASAAGMTMEDQQKVFSSVSKSITAFGLGGEEATLTFYAISQMMAKGKISAEELRRQLGERMPIAMEAMSRAAKRLGFQENLDDLLKGGKLRSLDILPKFAEELDGLIVSVDTDNAETSVNRLKNTFASLAEDWDIAGKFKAVVDTLIKLLEGLRSNVSSVAGAIAGILSAKMLGGVADNIRGHYARIREANNAELKQIQDDIAKAEENVRITKGEVSRAEVKHQDNVSNARRIETERLVRAEQSVHSALARQHSAQSALASLEADRARQIKERASIEQSLGRNTRAAYQQYQQSVPAGGRVLSEQAFYERNRRALERHHAENLRLEQAYQRRRTALEAESARASAAVDSARARSAQAVVNARQQASARIAQSEAAVSRATEAHAQAMQGLANANNRALNSTAVNASTFAGRISIVGRAVRAVFASIRASITAMLSSFVPMAIIAGIGAIIGKLIEMKRSWTEVINAQRAYQAEANAAGNRSEEVRILRNLISILEDATRSEQERLVAKNKIKSLLGAEISDTKQLLALAKKRLDYELLLSRAKFAHEKMQSVQAQIDELNLERVRKGYKPITDEQLSVYKDTHQAEGVGTFITSYINPDSKDWGRLDGEYNRQLNEQNIPTPERYRRLMSHRGEGESSIDFSEGLKRLWALKDMLNLASKDAKELEKELTNRDAQKLGVKTDTPSTSTPAPSDTPSASGGASKSKARKEKKSDLEQAEEQYAKSLRELDGQLANRLITEEEYKRELNNLKEQTAKTIAGLLGDKAEGNATYQATKDYSKDTEESKAISAYNDELNAQTLMLERGTITVEQFEEAMRQATETLIRGLGSDPKLSEEGKKRLESAKQDIQIGGKYAEKLPVRAERDKTFDYKKDSTDIQEEELSLQNEYVEKLQEMKAAGYDVSKALDEAMQSSSSLKKGLEIAKIKRDFDELQRKVNQSRWDAFRDGVGAIRSVESSVKSLISTFESSDSSPLEKALAAIESIISLVEGIRSVSSALSALSQQKQALAKTSEALTQAEQAGGQISQMVREDNISAIQAEQTANTTAIASEVSGLATKNAAEVSASATTLATASSNIGAAAAEGTANAAKSASVLPFPANIIAIAGAISAAIALFSKIPKFARGGIVPGNSYSGDRVLAGVNSGELILNEAQQHNIASKLVGRGSDVDVDVLISERLRGSDLRRSIQRSTRSSKR